jgi:hypothetical protein
MVCRLSESHRPARPCTSVLDPRSASRTRTYLQLPYVRPSPSCVRHSRGRSDWAHVHQCMYLTYARKSRRRAHMIHSWFISRKTWVVDEPTTSRLRQLVHDPCIQGAVRVTRVESGCQRCSSNGEQDEPDMSRKTAIRHICRVVDESWFS